MKMASFLNNKRSMAGLVILSGLIFTTYDIQENSQKIKKITNFESGMHTCFSRVNQTYTAKLLADETSTYLTSNFQNLTEECFAEGILNVEESFRSDLANVAKKISNLASNVHWFHEDVLNPNVNKENENQDSRDVGSRFETIETTKDEILESVDAYKTEITNLLNKEKVFFYVASIGLIFLMIFEYVSTAKRKLLNLMSEKEAEAELLVNGGVSSVKVGEIIQTALEQNELDNCSKLFMNYHLNNLTERLEKSQLTMESLVTPKHQTVEEHVSEEIERIWNDDSLIPDANLTTMNALAQTKNLTPFNLDQATSNVIDLMTEKLFSKGVQIDVKIPENIMIKAKDELLEEALYHLFGFAVNSCGGSLNQSKMISIFAHKLGDVVAFDLSYTGLGFEEEFLKSRIGLSSSKNETDLDLKVAQALLEEIDAKVQLDNKIDQTGELIGGRVKIIFKGAKELNHGSKLVDLKVGSKRDILNNISEA